MNFTNSYRREVSQCFRGMDLNRYRANIIPNPLFRGFLTVDISKDYFEVPSAIRVLDLMDFPIDIDKACIKVFPLYVGEDVHTLNTGDAIMRKFMATTYETRLVKVETGKGDIYYGGKGMIFDRYFNPLLLCTYKSCFKEPGGPISRHLELETKVVHIHPYVFLDQTSIVHKAIISKFVPFLLSNTIRGNYSTESVIDITGVESKLPSIVIDDMSSIFSKSAVPIPSDTSESERINKFLLENEHLISAE